MLQLSTHGLAALLSATAASCMSSRRKLLCLPRQEFRKTPRCLETDLLVVLPTYMLGTELCMILLESSHAW